VSTGWGTFDAEKNICAITYYNIMIAIISSTIYPPDKLIYDSIRSRFSPQQRLEQTRETVRSLLRAGLDRIYIADNSGEAWVEGTEEYLKPAKVFVYKQYQYANKGISEIWLLNNLLDELPVKTPLIKISGRYILINDNFPSLGQAEVAVKIERNKLIVSSISTRCYLVKDKDIFQLFLKRTLCAVYGYSARIIGPRSLFRILKNSIRPDLDSFQYDDPPISIEIAAAHVLKKYKYDVKYLDKLGIRGELGAVSGEIIEE
jgi:hypothetical protein